VPESTRRRELGRGERVLPGVWRLRLPLPWPGVPHRNAWALRAGDGVDASGCELWMHPDHAHMTAAAEDPDEALARRLEVARMSGVPVEPLAEWAEVARKRAFGTASRSPRSTRAGGCPRRSATCATSR
jgi:hypothetical protein